jgi:hypothetical protein
MSLGIDSQPGGPVRQPYWTYQPARLHRLADRFLGSLNVYKFGLCKSKTYNIYCVEHFSYGLFKGCEHWNTVGKAAKLLLRKTAYCSTCYIFYALFLRLRPIVHEQWTLDRVCNTNYTFRRCE